MLEEEKDAVDVVPLASPLGSVVMYSEGVPATAVYESPAETLGAPLSK